MSLTPLLNPSLQHLPVYQPGRPIEEVARELGLPVESIIKIASNENPLGPSPAALAAIQAVLPQLHLYPDGNAFYLKQKLAAKLGVRTEHLILGNGSNELIEFVGHALLGSGDEVVVSQYCFAVYPIVTHLFGAKLVTVPAKQLGHDLHAMRQAISPRAKLVFVANPNNPTGTMAPATEVMQLIQETPPNVLLVMDEAYIDFLEKPIDLLPLVLTGKFPNLILLRTFSKIYGLAGLRLGYGIGHPEFVTALEKIRQPFNINMVAQAAAAGKLHWLNLQFSGSLPFNLWMGLLGATALAMSTHGANQLIVQRVLTCQSVADGRKALVLSAVIVLPLFAIFLLCGTMLWAYYQQTALPIPLPANQAGFKQIDYIFPIFIMTGVPHVLKGFLMVGLLSAAMSSVSSAMSALASVSTMDFIKPFCAPSRSESFYFRLSQYSTAFWAMMLVLVAYLSREVAVVLDWAFLLAGLTSGAMLGGLWLAIRGARQSVWPVMIGMMGSLLAMIAIAVWAKKWIDWPWFTLIGTIITLALAALVRMTLPRLSPVCPPSRLNPWI